MSDPNAPDAYPPLYPSQPAQPAQPAQPDGDNWLQQGQGAAQGQGATPDQPQYPPAQPAQPPYPQPLNQPGQPYQTFPGQGQVYQGPYSQPAPPQGPPPTYQGPYSQPAPPQGYPPQGYPGYGSQGPYSQPMPPQGYPPQGFGSQGPFSQPMPSGAYGQPGTPSQGMYGQPGMAGGMAAPNSQAMSGVGAEAPGYAPPGYAPPGYAPGYAGPNSQALYGQPGAPSQGVAPEQSAPPAAPRKRPRWIVPLIVVALILIVLGGGGTLAYAGYYVPTTTAAQKVAVQFCGDLTSQNYDDAYNILSSKLHSQYTQTQFDTDMKTLDQGGGSVSECKAANAKAYSYSFGASVATYSALAVRSTLGDLAGVIHLKQDGGAWKVDAVDSALLGANPASMQVIASYCSALQNQDYTTSYSLLGATLQSGETQSAYTSTEQLHDTIDGKVTACGVSTISPGADDSHTTLQVSITRTNLDAQTGSAVVDMESGAWKIQTLDSSAEGRDVGPYLVGQQFCGDLKAANYAAAYGLTSSSFQSAISKSTFISTFTQASGEHWSCGQVDFSTYKADSATASYDAPLELSYLGQTVSLNTRFDFVNENGAWKLADFIAA